MDQQSTLDMNVGDSMPPRSMSLPSEGIEEIETLNNLVISDSGGGDEGGDRGDEVEGGFRVPGAGDQGDGGLGDKREVAKQPEKSKTEEKPRPSQVTKPASLGVGTSSRSKIKFLDEFASKEMGNNKLPKTKKVLLALFAYLMEEEDRKANPNKNTLATEKALKSAAEKVTEDLKNIWQLHFSSPLIEGDYKIIIQDVKIRKKIMDLYTKDWRPIDKDFSRADRKESESAKKKKKAFDEKMAEPFNIAVQNYEEMFKKSGIKDYKEDVVYLKNQLLPEQIGSLGSRDTKQTKCDARKSLETSRAAAKKRKLEESSPVPDNEDANSEEEGSEDLNSNDPEYQCKERKGKRQKIDVMGKISIAGMSRNVSHGDRAVIAAATARALNIDLDQTNISVSSSKYHNKKVRKLTATKSKQNFDIPEHVALGTDGKMLKVTGSFQKSNRVAVVVKGISPGGIEKIIAVPETKSGSGEDESEAITTSLKEVGIKEQIKSQVFDTTASNTSSTKGVCFFCEEYVGHGVLWTACRHHTCELLCGESTEHVFGKTSSPGSSLFKRLANQWESLEIDYKNLVTLDTDSLPLWMREEAETVLEWAREEYTKGTFPRADYKELLSLLIVFLGGNIKNFQFRLPGPDHHARWMSKCIYFLKISLLSKVFKMSVEETTKVQEITVFLALIYCKYWFRAPLSLSAPRNDLEMYGLILQFRTYRSTWAFKLLEKMRHHLWYLTPQLIVLSLCDRGLSDEEREELAKTIHSTLRGEIKTGKPEFPIMTWPDRRPQMSCFVGPESWLLFDLLNLPGSNDWLLVPAAHWHNLDEYKKIETFLSNLPCVNDGSERAVAMIGTYINSVKDEAHKQDLLEVVQYYRQSVPDLSKDSLKNLPLQ